MGCLTLTVREIPADITLTAQNRNELYVDAECKNTGLKITAALVCHVGAAGLYQRFYVTEGPFVVENGYFMVRKQQ